MDNRPDVYIYYCHNALCGSAKPAALANLAAREDVALEAVPCSGRIDPRYVLRAFESGARAVCVLTCPTGHCKSMEGNLRALRRTRFVRKLLAEAGLDPNSLQIFLPAHPEDSALEAELEAIAQIVNDEPEQVREVAA